MLSFFLIFKEESKHMYPHWYSLFIHLGIISLNLLFYWYFSKSVDSKPQYQSIVGENYFWYLLIGELSLSIPLKFLSKPPSILKQLYLKSLLDEFIVLKSKLLIYLSKVTFCQIALELLKFIIYFILLIAAGILLDFSSFLSFVVLQLFYIPIFLFLGFMASTIVVYIGRGEKVVQILVSVLFILAGAYFPIEVLPQKLVYFLKFSPLTQLVSDTRAIFRGEDLFNLISSYHLTLLTSGLLLSFCSYKLFGWVLTHLDRPLSHKPYIHST